MRKSTHFFVSCIRSVFTGLLVCAFSFIPLVPAAALADSGTARGRTNSFSNFDIDLNTDLDADDIISDIDLIPICVLSDRQVRLSVENNSTIDLSFAYDDDTLSDVKDLLRGDSSEITADADGSVYFMVGHDDDTFFQIPVPSIDVSCDGKNDNHDGNNGDHDNGDDNGNNGDHDNGGDNDNNGGDNGNGDNNGGDNGGDNGGGDNNGGDNNGGNNGGNNGSTTITTGVLAPSVSDNDDNDFGRGGNRDEGEVLGESASGLRCSPSTQTVSAGSVASFSASGGEGDYTWSTPSAYAAGSGSTFSTTFTTPGRSTVAVASGDQIALCSVVVTGFGMGGTTEFPGLPYTGHNPNRALFYGLLSIGLLSIGLGTYVLRRA